MNRRIARWRWGAGALLVVALAVGACSSDDDGGGDEGAAASPSSSTTTEVPELGETQGEGSCALLGVDEVEAVLGSAPEPELSEKETSDTQMGYSLCRWTDDTSYVEVSVIDSPDRYHSRRDYVTQSAEEGGGAALEDLDGIGEEAFVVAGDIGGPQLASSALVGDQTVEVNLSLGGEETPELVADLLTKVIARL